MKEQQKSGTANTGLASLALFDIAFTIGNKAIVFQVEDIRTASEELAAQNSRLIGY